MRRFDRRWNYYVLLYGGGQNGASAEKDAQGILSLILLDKIYF
jgi:hypothetical protein